MVSMLRIDERLIHGQIAVAWVKTLAATHIVVINDAVAVNEMQKTALRMATPANIKLGIRNVQEGIELLNDPRAKNFEILAVVRTVEDARAVVDAVDDIKFVNIGNCGVLEKKPDSKAFSDYVKLTKEEIKELSQINEKVPVELQLIPEHPKKSFKKLLKGE